MILNIILSFMLIFIDLLNYVASYDVFSHYMRSFAFLQEKYIDVTYP